LWISGDIKLPAKVQEAMQMQVEAERKKRAQILESEGNRESAINVAEGQKRSQILASGKTKSEHFCLVFRALRLTN
jgi:regulator of protease activity HflC (stomatin/prohibitin superfamily)